MLKKEEINRTNNGLSVFKYYLFSDVCEVIQPCGIFFVKFPQGCMCCYGFTSSIFPLAFFLKSSS